MPEETKTGEAADNDTVIIKEPEMWTVASSLTREVEIESLEGPVIFKIRSMSGHDHTKMLACAKPPEAPMVKNFRGVDTPNSEDKDYNLKKSECELKRRVCTIDMCWMEIPGDNLEAKVQWASENLWHKNEISQLYEKIIDLSGFGNYKVEQKNGMPVIITDPKAWAESARRPTQITFQRSPEVKIGFIVKPISRIISMQIEQACPDPEIPTVPVPGKSLRLRQFVKDENDPAYLAKVEAMEDKRHVLVLEASLDWKIPGSDFDAKVNWLRQRPAGEIAGLYKAIINSVNKFQSRSDFM